MEITLNLIILLAMLIIIIILTYIIINLYKKLLWWEKRVFKIDEKLISILRKTKEIDERGLFEQDDEVGVLWSEVRNVIAEIEQIIL